MTRCERLQKVLPLLALLALLAGCPLPMHKMEAVFAESLQNTVGQSLEDLTADPNRFIGERRPTEIRELAHGNLVFVYGDYWGQHGMDRRGGVCDVFLEFDPETMRVVGARAEGGGCYRAY
jgi:hypothetical protein